jgi:hypothetical protein
LQDTDQELVNFRKWQATAAILQDFVAWQRHDDALDDELAASSAISVDILDSINVGLCGFLF